MILKEEKRNLFTITPDYYLAHCISADFALGKGIATEFSKRYDMANRLKRTYGYGTHYGAYRISNVFNLVTKDKYYQKPTYHTLSIALTDMREQALHLGVKKIAMPVIGCGLDRLEWRIVRPIIESIFGDTDIEILICRI